MAILHIEGFEAFGTSGAPVGLNRKYFAQGTGALVTGRTGGLGFETPGTGANFFPKTPSNPQTIIIGFGFKINTLGTESIVLCRGGGSNNIVLKINTDGSLAIARGTTVLATTSAGIIVVDTWFYIEIKTKIDNTTGSYELKVDETTLISDTNVDTQDGTSAFIDEFIIRGRNGSLVVYDDFYILDDTGTENNDFLGKSVIVASYPNAAGDNADFTPDTGSNFARVNENPTDDDSSWVESSTLGHQDLHNHDDLSPADTIRGIQVNTEVRDTVAGGSSLKSLVKSGATLDTGPANTIGGTSYEYDTRILEQDPNTSAAWTPSGLDAIQIGYEVG